jgi:hypothetical protein
MIDKTRIYPKELSLFLSLQTLAYPLNLEN